MESNIGEGSEYIPRKQGKEDLEVSGKLNQEGRVLEGTSDKSLVQKENKSGNMNAKEGQHSGDIMLIEYPGDWMVDGKVITSVEGQISRAYQNTVRRVPLKDCTNISSLDGGGVGGRRMEKI